jgi:hypothetical protein
LIKRYETDHGFAGGEISAIYTGAINNANPTATPPNILATMKKLKSVANAELIAETE